METKAATKNCAFLFLTETCNLRCAHCYVEAGPGVGRSMSMETFELAIDTLCRVGVDDIRLTGGEPTIHPAFRHIVRRMHRSGLKVGLVTNGVTLLTAHDAPDILSMLARCWVSLYGPSAVRHASTSGRQERTFSDTINQVGSLAARGCWIGLSVLVAPGDLSQVDTLLKIASTAGVKRLRLLPVQPDGRAAAAQIDWEHWPTEVRAMACELRAHPMASKFEQLTINDPFDLSQQYSDSHASCLLGKRAMWSVVPDGSVYPCCFTVYSQGLRMGSVSDPDIVEKLVSSKFTIPDCHGLTRGFWRGIEVKTISCPISSLDPRHLAIDDADANYGSRNVQLN